MAVYNYLISLSYVGGAIRQTCYLGTVCMSWDLSCLILGACADRRPYRTDPQSHLGRSLREAPWLPSPSVGSPSSLAFHMGIKFCWPRHLSLWCKPQNYVVRACILLSISILGLDQTPPDKNDFIQIRAGVRVTVIKILLSWSFMCTSFVPEPLGILIHHFPLQYPYRRQAAPPDS